MILKNLFNKNADQLAKEAIEDYKKNKDEFSVIQKFQKALKIGIQHYPLDEIYLYIGSCYYDLSLYDKANEAYEKGLEYNSKNASLLSNLGITYSKLGDLEKSITYYKASLEIKPNNAYAYHNIGFYHYEKGNHFEAIDYFNNAINANAGLSDAYAVKARCLAYIGKYKEANIFMKEALKKGFDSGSGLKSDLEIIKDENKQENVPSE